MIGRRRAWRAAALPIAAVIVFLPRWPAIAQAVDGEAAPRCWHLGQDIVVPAGETLACSLVVVGGDVSVEATGIIAGDLAVPFGRADVHGTVAGDAFASGGLRLGESALVEGDAASLGEVVVADGARVTGRIDRLTGQPRERAAPAFDIEAWSARLAYLVILALLAALTSALAIVVAGEPVEQAARRALGSPRRLVGGVALGMVAGTVGIFLAAITLPTIFLPLVVLALLLGALAIGTTALAERLGSIVLRRGDNRPLRAAVGAALLVVIVFGPLLVPRLGIFLAGLLFDLLVLAAALGAGVLGMAGAWRSPGHRQPGSAAPSLPIEQSVAAGAADAVALPASPDWSAPASAGPIPTEHEPAGGADGAHALASSEHAPSGLPVEVQEPGKPFEMHAAHAPGDAEEPAPEAIGVTEPVPAAAEQTDAAPQRVIHPATVRDLEGMTPIYAHLLGGAGFATLAALAEADPAAVVRLLSVPGLRPVRLETAEAWVRAAGEARASAP